MSPKKTSSGNHKKSIAPTVLSALTIAPAIITAVEELMDKLPDIPGKVAVPQLYGLGFPLKLDQAITRLTKVGLTVMPSELGIREANPKYRNCVDSEVVDSDPKSKRKVAVGYPVIIRYITQEVIDESQRLFEELERQETEANRIKNEKREPQKAQTQRTVADAVSQVKGLPEKILHHNKKGTKSKAP